MTPFTEEDIQELKYEDWKTPRQRSKFEKLEDFRDADTDRIKHIDGIIKTVRCKSITPCDLIF